MLYYIVRGILRPFIYLFYQPDIIGLENVPEEGKIIIYSNHTSLLDPIVLGCLFPRKIHFMAKHELFKNAFITRFLMGLGAFPVKRGTADLAAIKYSLQILKQGNVFGIFPEGTRNKTNTVQAFSHGIAAIAHKSKALTLPVAIFKGYRLFRRIKVVIGSPLQFQSYYEQKSSTELLESMSQEMSHALQDIFDRNNH